MDGTAAGACNGRALSAPSMISHGNVSYYSNAQNCAQALDRLLLETLPIPGSRTGT